MGRREMINLWISLKFWVSFVPLLLHFWGSCRERKYLSSGNSLLDGMPGFLPAGPALVSFHLIFVTMSRSGMIMPLYKEVTWPAKVKCEKVVEQVLESRSSASTTSPVWDSPIQLCWASWQESGSGYPNLKPVWSAVGSALTSWSKPHPL